MQQSHITAHPRRKAAHPLAEQGLSQRRCRMIKGASVEAAASERLQWDWRDLKLALSETEDVKIMLSTIHQERLSVESGLGFEPVSHFVG